MGWPNRGSYGAHVCMSMIAMIHISPTVLITWTACAMSVTFYKSTFHNIFFSEMIFKNIYFFLQKLIKLSMVCLPVLLFFTANVGCCFK